MRGESLGFKSNEYGANRREHRTVHNEKKVREEPRMVQEVVDNKKVKAFTFTIHPKSSFWCQFMKRSSE